MNNEIVTTRGILPIDQLERIVGLEDRPDKIVLWVEWRTTAWDKELVRRDAFPLPTESGAVVYTIHGDLPRRDLLRSLTLAENDNEYCVAVTWFYNGELVRRDAHVILKQSSAVASAIADGF